MAKTRPLSPESTLTTTTVKSGPGGRKFTTRVEKSKPKYSFRIDTKTTTESAIPEEIELDCRHFRQWPGILKLLQLLVAVLCIIFFSPPLTWFTRLLCIVVAICFAITVFVSLFYLFTLRRVVCPSWPWLLIESIYTNMAAAAYLVSSILQILFTNKEEYQISLRYHDYYHDYLVAGAIGLINFVLYALGGQLLHNKWRKKVANRPKVYIVRTTLDNSGRPIKKVTEHKRISSQSSTTRR